MKKIKQDNKVYFKWTHDAVELKDLKFDDVDYQCYFVSFDQEQSELALRNFKEEYKNLLNNLREFYLKDDESLISKFHLDIEVLDFDDLTLLRKVVGLEENYELFLKAAKSGKSYFLLYFLEKSSINIDLSKSKNETNTLLQNILLPPKMLFRWKIIQLIFHHGYRMTESDRIFLKTFNFHEEMSGLRVQRIINIYAYNALGQRTYIEWFEKINGTVYTILSAKFNEIVGHGFPNFISLANNAIHSYKTTYPFIEQAFKYYKVWDKVIAEDQKKTFLKKHQEYLSDNAQSTDSQGHLVLKMLFEEIFSPTRLTLEWIKLEDIQ